VSGSSSAIFVSRLLNLPVMDAGGEQVGKVRDVVVQNRSDQRPPRVKGLVVELFARRRVFLPMERVHSVDAQQVIISGVVNTRRFERREQERLVVGDLFDKLVQRAAASGAETIFDVAILRERTRDWSVAEVALREATGRRPFSRGHVTVVGWHEVPGFFAVSGHETDQLVARLIELKPADMARELHEMTHDRQAAVAQALDDTQLAEALEQLPEEDQVRLIGTLDTERAADVLEEMDPDDAADLIAEMPPDLAETIMGRMDPEEAEDVRALLGYDAATAGGLMSPEPIIIPPDATVADALALIRNENVTPAMGATVYVCRPPLETPTGRYLGGVHYQRLLREPPSTLAALLVDNAIAPLNPDYNIAQVSRYFATYDLVSAPVLDAQGRLLGAVTVDDVLDHILPRDWRDVQLHGLEEAGDGVR